MTSTRCAPAPRASVATASAERRVSSACAGSAQMLGMRTSASRSARASGSTASTAARRSAGGSDGVGDDMP